MNRHSSHRHSSHANGNKKTENGDKSSEKKSKPRVCRHCGQHHSHHEPHLYEYVGKNYFFSKIFYAYLTFGQFHVLSNSSS